MQLSLTDEQFPVDEELGRGSLTTSVSDLATEARCIAQVSNIGYTIWCLHGRVPTTNTTTTFEGEGEGVYTTPLVTFYC